MRELEVRHATFNGSATEVLFLRPDVAAIAEAANAVRPDKHQSFGPKWYEALDAISRIDSLTTLEEWYFRQISSLVRDGKLATSAVTKALHLTILLRERGVLLPNAGMFDAISIPIFRDLPFDRVSAWPYRFLNGIEREMIERIPPRFRGDLIPFIISCAPSGPTATFSSADFLRQVDVLTGQVRMADSQQAHRIRACAKAFAASIGERDAFELLGPVLRRNRWAGRPVRAWDKLREKLPEWVMAIDEYLPTRRISNEAQLRDHLSRALRWLDVKQIEVAPANISRSLIVDGPNSLVHWLRAEYPPPSPTPYKTTRELYLFLNWLVDAKGLRSNPMRPDDIVSAPSILGKTKKALIPNKVLKIAQEICEELIEAAYSESGELSERMSSRFDSLRVTAQGVLKLSPVRPTMILTLILLPLRSIQVRMLDSGEADEFRPEGANYGPDGRLQLNWAVNRHPLAEAARRQGFLRELHDASAQLSGRPSNYVGFWVTTNKTPIDKPRPGKDGGFEIPWQRDDLIVQILRLLAWQEANNPLLHLLGRDELKDANVKPTAAMRGKFPRYAYLFREHARAGAGSQEPPTYAQLGRFFRLILAEVEDRLKERGYRGPEGHPVQLVEYEGGEPRAHYTLHGLRVAGISAFAEAGVPTPVIAEFLAGHATVLMNLYYQKFGPATVTELLNEALDAIESGKHELWGHDLSESAADGIGKFVGHPSAWKHSRDGVPGLWAVKLDGVCPNGQVRCHEGMLLDHGASGPVPGGPSNCPQCRFWLTGPTFVAGQVLAINAHLFKIKAKSEALIELHSQRRRGHRSTKIADAIDGLEAELNHDVATLNARHQHLAASLRLEQEGSGTDGGHQLITKASAQHVRRDLATLEVANLEMYDFVARTVEIFPELNAEDAFYRRNQLIDQILDRDGFQALLYRMSHAEARRFGSDLCRFITDLHGPGALSDLADGRLKFGDGIDLTGWHGGALRLKAEPITSFVTGPAA